MRPARTSMGTMSRALPTLVAFATIPGILGVLAGCSAGPTDAPTSGTSLAQELPRYYDVLPPSGISLDLAGEILNGVSCTYSQTLEEDTMYFVFPSGPWPQNDTVITTSPKAVQTNQDGKLKDPGWVWVEITGGNTTEYRPRLDMNLVTESYIDLPSPGSISLTAEANSSSGCSVLGWRVPGDTIMPAATVSYSTSWVPSQLLAVFDCGGDDGMLRPTR